MTTATDIDGVSARTRKTLVASSRERYWRSNLRIMAALLVLWAFASFGCGVLLADWLNEFNLPFTGFPLGFWFAHQGAIVVFVLCILLYCIAMNRLDRRHHEELERIAAAGAAAHEEADG